MFLCVCVCVCACACVQRLVFPEDRPGKRKHPDSDAEMDEEKKPEPVLQVIPYSVPNRGPYLYNLPKKLA